MTLPWMERRVNKNFMHKFVDVLCHLPRLIQDTSLLENLADDTVQKTTLRDSIRTRILQLSAHLFETRWQWELTNPACCCEFNATDLFHNPLSIDENGKPLFGTSYFFNDMARAVEINFYNIANLLLWNIAKDVDYVSEMMTTNPMDLRNSSHPTSDPSHASNAEGIDDSLPSYSTIPLACQPTINPPSLPSDPQASFSATAIPPNLSTSTLSRLSQSFTTASSWSRPKTNPCLFWPHELDSPKAISYEVCRSVDYYFLSQHSTQGAFFIIFPIRTLQYNFEKTDWESQWLRRVLQMIGDQGFKGVYEFC
jgi:hypothetical protein